VQKFGQLPLFFSKLYNNLLHLLDLIQSYRKFFHGIVLQVICQQLTLLHTCYKYKFARPDFPAAFCCKQKLSPCLSVCFFICLRTLYALQSTYGKTDKPLRYGFLYIRPPALLLRYYVRWLSIVEGFIWSREAHSAPRMRPSSAQLKC
jgi:hypothetical protein